MEWRWWYSLLLVFLVFCKNILDFSVGLVCWAINALSKKLIFPQPKPDYDLSYLEGQMLLVPKRGVTDASLVAANPMNKYIPCRVFGPQRNSRRYLSEPPTNPDTKSAQNNKKVIIYFHGNGEDIGQVHEVLETICQAWKAHAVAVEYPGYGIYPSPKNGYSRELFLQDAERVYEYIQEELGCDESQILIVGRSIGSGIATLLAHAKPRAGALFLVSAYTSIHGVVGDKIPGCCCFLAPLLKCFIPNYFDNLSLIKSIRMPVFFLHGQRDEVIPFKHSAELFNSMVHKDRCLVEPPHMTHNNNIEWDHDLGDRGAQFLQTCRVAVDAVTSVDMERLLLSHRNVAAIEENRKSDRLPK